MSGLIFYMHDGPGTFRFELSGDLAGGEVAKLDQAWRTASSTVDGKALAVDVTFLTAADERGRELLKRWWRAGAHFVANSPVSRQLVEAITGTPYAPAAVGPTFEPRFTAASLRAIFVASMLAFTLLFPATAAAEESATVLDRYSAGLADGGGLDRVPATVEIEASVPKLDKQAHIAAIRRWAAGKRNYQFVAAEGDSFVRREMIARYFEIDTDASPMAAPITKSNYRFRFVEEKDGVSVFHVTPRKKRLGMIDGDVWIDTRTGQMVRMAGRLVKSPSILLKRVDIAQDTEFRDGVTVSRETHLGIDTRFTGRAELTIRERAYRAEEVAENVTP